jgi:hypothetical protein
MMRWLPAAALASGVLVPAVAAADPLPLRIDYHADAGCPGEDVFLDEIRWRTALARVAAPGDAALEVRVRVDRRGAASHGEVTLGQGGGRVVRAIHGDACDEVVSALALITALAVDPHASLAHRQPGAAPAPPPAAPAAEASPSSPSSPPSGPAPKPETLPPPDLLADPLPADLPAPVLPPPARRDLWAVGAQASMALAVTPGPLAGGAIFAGRVFDGALGASVRLAVEVEGTGTLDAGPGQVWFLRGAARVTGCAFTWRPAAWISAVPCVAIEAGALHGQGVAGGALTSALQATVAWAGAGVLPRVGIEVGPGILELEGGPVFPLVRRTFVFKPPEYVIHTVPPVTGTIGLGWGMRFP